MMKTLSLRTARFLYRKIGLSKQQEFENKPFADMLHAADANQLIASVIRAGKPAMISRFGTPESNCLLNYLELQQTQSSNVLTRMHGLFQNKRNEWDEEMKTALRDLVGFFPVNEEQLIKFAPFYIEQVKKIDLIGVWGFVPGETYLINRFCPKALKYDPMALEPYYFEQPWSAALEGKKVLVIHPFVKSIQQQFTKRTLLFSNQQMLPDFELKTIAAVQSIAGNETGFATWFDALAWMQQQIDAIDFDVAIIGAGSYGLPLSAYIKEKGKIAVHIGGATQILFGIKGKRWDDHQVIGPLYNEHWIRPSVEEAVPQAHKVEDACYW